MSLLADTAPLRTPDFRRLWLAGIVTVVGANLTIFAVPVQIYALTQNSAYVGLAGLFALVPLIVFGLWGGAWADAMDRRSLLIVASCGLALASVLLWAQAAWFPRSPDTVLTFPGQNRGDTGDEHGVDVYVKGPEVDKS